MSDRKWSCDSHPRRTEFDCARCGFQQVDTLREMLRDTQDALREACDLAESRLTLLGMDDYPTPAEKELIAKLRKFTEDQ